NTVRYLKNIRNWTYGQTTQLADYHGFEEIKSKQAKLVLVPNVYPRVRKIIWTLGFAKDSTFSKNFR
ncbi:MAG TPA: hypothetical protein VK638_49285, partial [Edaphobacter sp.]|nr:hypothetical protein [Edaphobacter sp.]